MDNERIYTNCKHWMLTKIKTKIMELSAINEKKKPVGRPKKYNLMRG